MASVSEGGAVYITCMLMLRRAGSICKIIAAGIAQFAMLYSLYS